MRLLFSKLYESLCLLKQLIVLFKLAFLFHFDFFAKEGHLFFQLTMFIEPK